MMGQDKSKTCTVHDACWSSLDVEHRLGMYVADAEEMEVVFEDQLDEYWSGEKGGGQRNGTQLRQSCKY